MGRATNNTQTGTDGTSIELDKSSFGSWAVV